MLETAAELCRSSGGSVGGHGLILDALESGTMGCVSGMANVVPDLVVRIYRSWKSGDLVGAPEAQDRLESIR